MELRFNVTGTSRKELVSIISETIGMKAIYKFMPTCAFVIDNMTVDKEGTIHYDERTSKDTLDAVMNALTVAGFAYEQNEPVPEQEPETTEAEPTADTDSLTVSLPMDGFDALALTNLNNLLTAKGNLIKKALQVDALPVETTDEKVSFPWFHRELTAEEIQAYSTFIAELCGMAKNAKRITATEKPVENEKYALRCFLLRLGFIGNDYKAIRKTLMQHLTGSAAFKSGAKKMTKEVASDAISE